MNYDKKKRLHTFYTYDFTICPLLVIMIVALDIKYVAFSIKYVADDIKYIDFTICPPFG